MVRNHAGLQKARGLGFGEGMVLNPNGGRRRQSCAYTSCKRVTQRACGSEPHGRRRAERSPAKGLETQDSSGLGRLLNLREQLLERVLKQAPLLGRQSAAR